MFLPSRVISYSSAVGVCLCKETPVATSPARDSSVFQDFFGGWLGRGFKVVSSSKHDHSGFPLIPGKHFLCCLIGCLKAMRENTLVPLQLTTNFLQPPSNGCVVSVGS